MKIQVKVLKSGKILYKKGFKVYETTINERGVTTEIIEKRGKILNMFKWFFYCFI